MDLLKEDFHFLPSCVMCRFATREIVKAFTYTSLLVLQGKSLFGAIVYANVNYNEQHIIKATRNCIKLNGFHPLVFLGVHKKHLN